MQQAESGGLPSGYQQIEYIRATGTQYIDTGTVPYTNTVAQIKFKNLQETGNVIFGYYNGNDQTDWRLFNHLGHPYFDLPVYSGNTGKRLSSSTSVLIPENTIKEIELGNFYVMDMENDDKIFTTASQFIGTDTITLGKYTKNNGDSTFSKNEWYYVRIFDGNTIVRDMIPCRRNADGEIGMYDIVTGNFFTNQGTGSFGAGSDV